MSETTATQFDEHTAQNDAPVAVITGAGSGIGRATAVRLAERGYRSALVGRTRESLEGTADLCDGETLVLVADLCEPGSNRSIISDAIAAFGRLDAVVLNAGWSPLRSVADAEDGETRRIIDLNLTAPTLSAAEACRHFVDRGTAPLPGRVVLTSSYATVDPFPGLGLYAAAKAGVNLLARAIHNELHERGVRAFAVAPGAVETPLLRSLFDESMIPSDACLSPDAVAEVIAACATGARDEESGQTILLPSPGSS